MIVRESPKSGRRQDAQNWPPKSPYEALLSSPSGRKKYERQRDRGRHSVSPSPVKRRSQPQPHDEGDEEEDEETLQLQLQAIEARLKLKRLQRARKSEDEGHDNTGAPSRLESAASSRKTELPRPQSEVQVPVSPVRNRREPQEQTSPARVMLGIDKGLRAQDVSLKRASTFSARGNNAMGGHSRTNSSRVAEAPRGKSFNERIAESRNKEKEREEKQTRIENSRSRGFGLKDIEALKDRPTSRTGSSLSSGTKSSQDTGSSSRNFERVQSRPSSDAQNANPPPPRPSSNFASRPEGSRPSSAAASRLSPKGFGSSASSSKYAEIASRDNSTEAASFESFSGLHLKSREMQHNTVTRTLEGKTILTIPQLLKTVKAPAFDPPDMENDYVVMGVICSKSSPLTPKNSTRDQSTKNPERDAHQGGKFMVIRLTDLKWELDLYLFDTGFSQFWKLSVGTLIAVLNPDIMPPRQRDTGKFSLKLTSSDDTVLEIGTARDLDFCHAMRKDGKECSSWIDSRKTEYCDFHIELQVEKSRRGRMEINNMGGFGKGPGGGGAGGKFGMFKGGGGGGRTGGGPKADELPREGRFHDKFLHETVYIAPSAGGAARLIDRDEQPWERGASREERHRKQLADTERERELAKKLGQMGSGAGGDYMKARSAAAGEPSSSASASGNTQSAIAAKGDTSHLEDPFITRGNSKASNADKSSDTVANDFASLLDRKADDVSLAPVKRKRTTLGKSASTSTSDPVGWGGALKRGLLLSPSKRETTTTTSTSFNRNNRPTSSSSRSDARESSPAKKKARLLVPDKGVREPGRESLGGLDIGLIAAEMDEDEDDLEVV